MHCLNLANGESVWKRPVKRGGKLFVAAVRKGIVSAVSNHFVHGIDLDTGEQKWTLKLDTREYNQGKSNLPTGFGFRSGDHYFLPTFDSILEINVVTGKLVKTLSCEEPLGTIVPYDDQIVSLGLDYLRKYHQSDRLAATVATRLNESPNDAWALEQSGALLFEAGKINAGMTALRKAIESYPTDAPERDRAKRLFVSVALVALERNFAGNLPLAVEIEKWIERPEDRQEFLLLRANGMLSVNKPRQAFDSLKELIFAPKPSVSEYATFTKQQKTQYTVRQDRSIRTGIKSVLRGVSQAEATVLLATLRDGCDRLISDGSVSRIRTAIRELGDLPVADSLRLFAAEKIAADQPVAAEILLLPVMDSDVPEHVAEAHCLTAAIYANSDYHRAAARCYSIARENWPETRLQTGQTVDELCKSFPATSSVGKYLRSGPKWQYGATTFAQVAKPLANRRPSLLVSIVQQKALTPHAPKLDFWHDGNSFVATDRLGRERNRIPAPMRLSSASTRPTTCRQLGSLSLVNFGNVIVAVNNLHPIDPTKITRQGPRPIVWPKDYSSQMSRNLVRTSDIAKRPIWKQKIPFPQNRKIHGMATASVNGLVYLTGNQLICVDPLSGEELWSRSDITPKSRVWGDDQHVLVEVKNGPAARIFDIIDGHEVAQVDIPTSERRWSTIGRDIVAWANGTKKDGTTTRVLYLFDPLTQERKWSRECKYSAPIIDEDGESYTVEGAGYVADDQFACILEPDGRCMIIDLATGDLHCVDRFELPSDKNLTGVNLIVTDEQFTVVVHFQLQTDDHFIHKKPNVATSVRDGFIQAYSRKSGRPQWAHPVVIDRFGLFEYQPRDVPVLLFARNTSPRANRNVRPKADIIGIDRRDGRRLFVLERQSIPSSEYRIQANSEQSVDFRFPNSQQFRLQFSDEPVAPAPPLPVSISRLPAHASKTTRADTNQNQDSTRLIERSPFELEE